jgi:L-alanine-DL-glutamate epimerase-like enolase superfamily enzyme
VKLSWSKISLSTKFPFVISRWGYAAHENVIVTLTDRDGLQGMGEAAPNRYYGETPDTVIAALQRFAPILEERSDATPLEALEQDMFTALRENASARAAVSAALHDLHAKRLGVPLYYVWGLDPSAAPLSSYTIAIADEEGLRLRVQAAADYPILKIKLGTDRDVSIVQTVRDTAPHKTLRVDANGAWTPKHAVHMAYVLREYGVESIEQPVVAHDIEGLQYVYERSPLPIIADESCLVATDIPRIARACDGINIKLAKCGSLREALRMVHVARAHNLQVMAGCMIETSLGISAIAQIAPLLDHADFDGAALLSDDPFEGVSIAKGQVTLSDVPGLGVRPRNDRVM